MKKLLLAGLLVVVPGSLGSVALADDDVGCGLGTQLWVGQRGLAPKVLAATTNGSFGNQTFGITSGTLGCEQDGVITAQYRVNMFAGANLDHLARDMAAGEGETLDSLAALLGVPGEDRPVLFHLSRDHFGELFPSADVTAGDMLARLNRLMAQDPVLSAYATL